MIFNTIAFACFLAVVLGAYWSLRSDRWRQRLLLAANFFFYGWWDWRFTGLLLAVVVVCYVSGRLLQNTTGRTAKLWLFTGCAAQLALLGYFKYANFFLDSLRGAVERMGGHVAWTTLNIILPAGISFYVFQGISYIVNVYYRRISAERDFVKLGVYLSFFPHLVAGPIIHAQYFLPQLAGIRRFDSAQFLEGCRKFATGFLYKAVFADNLARVVDPIFSQPSAQSGLSLFGGCLGFYGQIYFDFAGYSLMAIGISNLFGYFLPDNFNYPYGATSMVDFWRRWHISLSTWLRDYVYIPLGGNRGSKWFQYRNLMITMFLGGLWHGASWNFVLWGSIHGGALCVNHVWRTWRESSAITVAPAWAASGKIAAFFLTQGVVFLCWIPFRAKDFAGSMAIFSGLWHGLSAHWGVAIGFPWLLAIVPLVADTWIVGNSALVQRLTVRSNTVFYVALGLAMLIGFLFMHLGTMPFLYFKF